MYGPLCTCLLLPVTFGQKRDDRKGTKRLCATFVQTGETRMNTALCASAFKHDLSRKVLQEKKNRTKFGEIEFQQETHDMITMEIVMKMFMFALIS